MKTVKIFVVFSAFILSITTFISTNQRVMSAAADKLETARQRAVDFINQAMVPEGAVVELRNMSVEEGNGLYYFDVYINDQKQATAYMTPDLKYFFPQRLDIDEMITEVQSQKKIESEKEEKLLQEIPKLERPQVELFVMSHCPYGIQIEKGILPVTELLGDKIDFEIKFVNYAMHGQNELNEEIRQYCIQKEYHEQFNDYLTCFLKEGKSDDCLDLVGSEPSSIWEKIKSFFSSESNQTDLESCTIDTDDKYHVTADYEGKENWHGNYPGFAIYEEDNIKYGVQGSPTLVINGKEVQSARDSASLLKSICNSFITQPAECQTEMPSIAPSPGFGEGSSPSDNGSCE